MVWEEKGMRKREKKTGGGLFTVGSIVDINRASVKKKKSPIALVVQACGCTLVRSCVPALQRGTELPWAGCGTLSVPAPGHRASHPNQQGTSGTAAELSLVEALE